MTNLELFQIISKVYLTAEDIKKISGKGWNWVYDFKKKIVMECEKEMIMHPRNAVPTEKVLGALKIDIKKVQKLAQLEKELK